MFQDLVFMESSQLYQEYQVKFYNYKLKYLGAGKTTLLNLLSSRIALPRKHELTGDIEYNKKALPIKKALQVSAYVMQKDILFETMTPREILYFSCRLRLNKTHK